FTIPKGPVCVDPSSRWVKRAMDIIDRRTKANEAFGMLLLVEDQTSRKETKAKPPPTPKTKRTVEQNGYETEGRPRSTAEPMRTDPAVDQDGYETKGPTRSTPETMRTDPAVDQDGSFRSSSPGAAVTSVLQFCVERDMQCNNSCTQKEVWECGGVGKEDKVDDENLKVFAILRWVTPFWYCCATMVELEQTYRERTESKPPPKPQNVRTDPAEHQDGSKTEAKPQPQRQNVQSDHAEHQDGYKTETNPPPTPDNMRTDPAEHQDESKTQAKPPPKLNTKTNRAEHQDESKTQAKPPPTPDSIMTDPATDRYGSTPKTTKTDSAEPKWFSHIEA
ncbi:hypothetical protein NFI96_027628, partial [Prochilodus magdalenae]